MITITDQGLSYIQYETDGTTDNFTLTFPYLKQADLKVFLDGVETAAFTWLNSSEIQMNTAPLVDQLLTLIRTTEQNERLVDFQDGGVLKEATLDLDSNQLFYLAQEALDSTSRALAVDSTTSVIDAKNNRIINMQDGIDAQDGVTVSQYNTALGIANSALASSAAAVISANAAVATANGIAATAATALSTANTALSTANAAVVTANGIAATAATALANANAAVVTANAAGVDATQALADAATAQAAANAAQADATQALADAATALAAAGAAQSTANTALANAATAQSTANTANSDLATHMGLTAAHGATGAVVGTTNTQTLTNKTMTAPVLNSPSIVTPSQSDIKQDTKANLDAYALTATNGQLCWATDLKQAYAVKDFLLVSVGGSSGSLDTIFQLIGEEAIGDWSTGDNATFLGAGALSGTFAKNTTAPLQGLDDYKYTQAAGSLNDYLCSPPRAVDARFRGKEATLFFPFLYDGNGNEIEVIFYDATNSAIIPSSVFIQNATNAQVFKTNIVIPSTCTSIRVGFHVKVLNSGKIFQFDSVQLSADTTVYAALSNITSWQAYTPTFQGFGTPSAVEFEWRQVGENVEIRGKFTSGTSTAVEARIGLPAGLSSAGTAIIPSIQVSGVVGISAASAASFYTLIEPSTSYVALSFQSASNATLTKQNANAITTLGTVVSIKASVPCSGLTATSTNILTAPETFSTDTAPLVYAGSGSYTLATLANAPVGTYITFDYAANTNTRNQVVSTRPTQTDADMNANGIRIFTRAYNASSAASQPAAFAIQIGKGLKGKSLCLYKSAGKVTSGSLDYYQNTSTNEVGAAFKEYNESTGILLLDAGWKINNANTGHAFIYSDLTTQTSGYLVINASKNPALTGLNISAVAARGISTSGQSLPTGVATVITLDSVKTFDTHSSLNAATGVFTAPEYGYYQVSGSTMCNATLASNVAWIVYLYKNGTLYSSTDYRIAATTIVGRSISDLVLLNKGDTLDMRVLQNSGGAVVLNSSAGLNWLSVTKTSVG